MGVVSLPNTFSPNTTISSSEVNSNFSTIYNEFNGSISSANLANDAVTTAKIDDDAVTTAKILNSAVTVAKRTGGFNTGTFLATGNGAVVVTGVGFRPKYIEVRLLHAGSQSGSVVNMVQGGTDGTTSWSCGFRAQESGDISGTVSTSFVCYVAVANQVRSNTLTFASFDSDGFTLTEAGYTSDVTFSYTAWA
jgi:hypothetical protein